MVLWCWTWVCPFVLGELWRANWARQRGFSLSWGRGGCSGRPNARCPGLGNGTICVRTSVFELARRMAAVASQRLRKSGDVARCSARAPSARSFDSRAVGCSIGLRGLVLLSPRGWIIAGALRCRGARCCRNCFAAARSWPNVACALWLPRVCQLGCARLGNQTQAGNCYLQNRCAQSPLAR